MEVSDDHLEEIKQMIADGHSIDKIADTIGFTHRSVARCIRRKGIDFKSKYPMSEEKLKKMQEQSGIYRQKSMQTICWDCKNAYGGCSWSEYKVQQPVEGWKATPKLLDGNGQRIQPIQSYIVHECPLFEKDDTYYKPKKRK